MARKPNLASPVAVLRTALGLTAGEFARLVGAGKSTIQHIETGDRPLKAELADAIHVATGFPRDWLDRPKITLDEARGWARVADTDGNSSFNPRTLLEKKTAGGPKWFGLARYNQSCRLEAIFYRCALSGINPHLVELAVKRLESNLIQRFHLDERDVDRLEDKIADALRKPLKLERPGQVDSNPGYCALKKHFESFGAKRRARAGDFRHIPPD